MALFDVLISHFNVQHCELSLCEFGYHYKFRVRLCSFVHCTISMRLSPSIHSFAPLCMRMLLSLCHDKSKYFVCLRSDEVDGRPGATHQIVESTKLCANIDSGLFIRFYWIWHNKIAMQTPEFHFVDYYLLLSLIQCVAAMLNTEPSYTIGATIATRKFVVFIETTIISNVSHSRQCRVSWARLWAEWNVRVHVRGNMERMGELLCGDHSELTLLYWNICWWNE